MILQSWENESSGIDHTEKQLKRPFQYGDCETVDVLIDPGKWAESRFSNGKFGVWYGALEEETSLKEAFFHFYQYSKPDFKNACFPIISDRRMFSAQIESNYCVNLRLMKNQAELKSDHYSYCQNLAIHAKKNNTEMLLTPSARNENGVCVPVFKQECIKRDKLLYYAKFTILNKADLRITKESDIHFTTPNAWL